LPCYCPLILTVGETAMVKALHKQFFGLIHGRRLIYNTCWEDPRIDRQLLGLGPDSSVVVITSAGCNALEYLLDDTKAIHAVDMNFRQNALLLLKMALYRHGDHEALFALFGRGGAAAYREIYAAVREGLPAWAQGYWDDKIGYFNPGGMRKSFYWRGAAGDFAWLCHQLLVGVKSLGRPVQAMLGSTTLDEQRRLYDQIEPHIFRRGFAWLWRQPAAMALVGVPTPQIRLIEAGYPGGLVEYLQERFKQVFTMVPFQDNYFWRVYLTGSYTSDCRPEYLAPENFGTIRERVGRVKVHNTTITGFLRENPGEYSHFILLDHQDWLAWHDTGLLLEEWGEIFRNSLPGAKILLRSAGRDLGFLPGRVTDKLRFFPERTRPLHARDRVGTYGSLHLAEVA
jgi:S-adenosylmethionine-diacylglycerol 3-amino-3-carboxypropyl transferase